MTTKSNQLTPIIQALRQRRRQLGLSQQELADLADVSLPSISRLERGKETTRLDVLIKLLYALGLELQITSKGEPYGNQEQTKRS